MRSTLCLALTALLATLPGYAADLRVLVEIGTDMPMAGFRGDQLVEGIQRDVGIALASRLGREARFISLPRKRIPSGLLRGEGDLACQYRPAWLPGDFDWTVPFMPNGVVLISNQHAARPASLTALADVPIGTVTGYAYPEVEQVLGTHFVRDDAPDSAHNLSKLTVGRTQHALIGERFLEYQQHRGNFTLPLHAPMVIQRYEAQCAVSRRSQVGVADLNRAIEAMKRDKTLAAIYARYR